VNGHKHRRPYLLACSLLVVFPARHGLAQQNSGASSATPQSAPTERDGQHDFDFSIGNWRTHQSRLLDPNDFTALAERGLRSLSATGLIRGTPELVVLDPTRRSRLRWLP
jgi:hypothetical protein